MPRIAHMMIHFMDGTKLVFKYPKMETKDLSAIASAVKKAIDTDKLAVEADGTLIVIPTRNIKYIQVDPVPDALPAGVLRHAQIVE